jgi:hypothetical protein
MIPRLERGQTFSTPFTEEEKTMVKRILYGCTALFLVGLLFALEAKAQEGGPDSDGPSHGTPNTIPIWESKRRLGNSNIFQGAGNIGIGTRTPLFALDVNGTINASTAYFLGGQAFGLGSYGNANAFLGFSGNSTTTGIGNTATGAQALDAIAGGVFNTASGFSALGSNTSGSYNTASGFGALYRNTTNCCNTASGALALNANTTGYSNTASGYSALGGNNTGSYNTASGDSALFLNNTGSYNTASGDGALFSNTTGDYNTALGFDAGYNATTGAYNIYIANLGVAAESNTIRIGDTNQTKTFIAGINGANVGTGVAIVVNSNGQLGTMSSSRRFKFDIQDMDDASDKLLQLRPVTFRYKQAQSDGSHPLQYGLIAEEVADAYPELVQNTPEGQPNAVLYHLLPAMLLNEFQKQHRQIEAQQQQIQSLQKLLAQFAAQARELQTEVTALKAKSERGNEVALAIPEH